MSSTLSSIQEILVNGSLTQKKALFLFDKSMPADRVLFKFNLWARCFFPQYFESHDAPFHKTINMGNLDAYSGVIDYFVDAAFRGAGKDVKTKLFIPFCILNDTDKQRRYYKVLSADLSNSKQTVTDIWNILVQKKVAEMYPEVFKKSQFKREETMSSFTTATRIKVVADTVGTEQRGDIQEDARPDFVWFNDFETRKTLRSSVVTRSIWDNMEEARTGLQKGGCAIYTCNYISELGNVHRLITDKLNSRKRVVIIPILDENGIPTWERYSVADVEFMQKNDEDFEGERMCKPSASKDVLFDRERLDRMQKRIPVKVTAGFNIFKEYNPSHRYGGGHDVGGGVGLDSSSSVYIDFSVIPALVVATYADNTTKPGDFGDEVKRESDMFGGCIEGVEKNNHGHATIYRAKQLGVHLYETQSKATKVGDPTPTEYGWSTNQLTKPNMVFAFQKAVDDGLLDLSDERLIQECKSYSRNDLMDKEQDPRLATRHFDLFMAGAIAWQMKDFATVKPKEENEEEEFLRNFDPFKLTG